MKKVFFIVILCQLALISFSQDQRSFVFSDQMRIPTNDNIDVSTISSHFLGPEIAIKMYQLESLYTFREPPSPTSPGTKTIVQKPVIFYATRKLNNYFRKEVRKHRMEESEAIERLSLVLDNAINIFYQDTEKFEEYLKKNKSHESIEKGFNNIVFE